MKIKNLILVFLITLLFSCKPVDIVQRTRKVTMDKQPSVIVTTEIRTYSWYGKTKEVKHWSIVVAPIEHLDSIKVQERRKAIHQFLYTRKKKKFEKLLKLV